ncbi:MAG: DJ-1/PfpI family protein [Clostridia bacterium]|nr:DJ-1/PfpI family protein [Clostridia bacterium]
MFYMFFADGFEEVEAIAALDVIRRAEIEIKSVGIGSKQVTGSHGITVICDKTEDEIDFSDKLEGIILPGGMPGTKNLQNNPKVNAFIDYCNEKELYICAICAAPMIPGSKGLLSGKKAVCFPGFEEYLEGAVLSDDYVCTDGKFITAKGMGSAVNFGLAIVSAVKGEKFSAALKDTLQCS